MTYTPENIDMIDKDKKCYVIFEDKNDPKSSYKGWAIVTDYRSWQVDNILTHFYEVTTLKGVEEEGVFFPENCVFETKPKPKITTNRPIYQDDVRHLAVLCVDLIIENTGMPDDESCDELFESIAAALEKHFDYPHYKNHN